MKKKDLIKKWLDNEQLTSLESEAFKNLDAYDSYIKISETAKKFKAPKYTIEDNLEKLNVKLVGHNGNSNSSPSFKILIRIAAIFILGIGTYFTFFNTSETKIDTLANQSKSLELPDQSQVWLNSISSLQYDTKDWENTRKIELEGEGFFKVAKGKKFDVITKLGVVSVLGTEFNVKQRDHYFEVICYEGQVRVSYNNEIVYLRKGDVVEIVDNEISKKGTSTTSPSWLKGKSVFTSTPYSQVLQEFEWQYGVTIIAKNIDQDKLFTGNFVHSDIQIALQSITLPMHLKYEINDNNVTLFKE